nr:immunoglobulin heavy chain junction region [Mus musculus]MBK4188274.1 immunoglobulin heavy chain junction region [Mus musculus]MBK4188275.1 immunoglobulin heavy chain junction region [Mus musculus]MBK4188276.1 immunoglobulin heavy chain junction region [Mus musculus]MBK4188277.1 immunoglobulin heavy chain junction region [Mus musculus]
CARDYYGSNFDFW